jgi:hypothetical protein
MRKVVDKHNVAHLWANQLQDEARTATGNLYFHGDTIYSYGRHFPIAKHVNGKILFTLRDYSVTTTQHKSIVNQACNHKNTIYCKNPNASHEENFNYWLVSMELAADHLPTARKPEKWLNEIAREYAQAIKYAEFFGLEVPETLKIAHSITDKAAYREYADKKQAALQAEEERKQERLLKQHKEALKKWRVFEYHYRSLPSRVTDQDYLRYNSTTNRIETSQGVQIPADIAKRFYNYVMQIISKGGCTDCTQKILEYRVKNIDKNGIVVGCHRILMPEIKRIAKLLNW